MPKIAADNDLLEAIEAVVRQSRGNESEAARKIGVSRLRINRVRKQRGSVTVPIKLDLWKRLERLAEPPGTAKKDTSDTEVIQIVRDVPNVALQVLRYMTDAIERDLDMGIRPDA